MSNYSIEKTDLGFDIREEKTGHIVYSGENRNESYKRLSFFNMGGAFDGWTPSFFMTESNIFEDEEDF